MKISIVGSGDVGAQAAVEIAGRQIADEIVLVDIIDGLPQGRAIDIQSYCPTIDSETKIIGTNSYSDTRNSDMVIITAGVARKPGDSSRDSLLETNKNILKSVTEAIVTYSPKTLILVVTNPVDVMTYHVWKVSGFESKRVFGMGGVLDVSRLKVLIAEKAGCMFRDVDALVVGSHGNNMVPLISHAKIKNRSVTEFLTSADISSIVEKTQNMGGTIINLTRRSTCYGPGGAIAKMAEVIANDTREMLPCSAYLDGEYGVKGVYAGVPVVLGIDGVESVVEFNLDEKEKELFDKGIEIIRKNTEKLNPEKENEKIEESGKISDSNKLSEVDEISEGDLKKSNQEESITKIRQDIEELDQNMKKSVEIDKEIKTEPEIEKT